MEKIEKYATYHELGLRFYGIKINGPLILKIGLLTINQRLYNLGVRYNYEYDKKQSNIAKYMPIELKYQNMYLSNPGIQSISNSNSIYYYPQTEFSTIFLSVGHGFGFILKQGGSFNIELAYQRHITLSQKFYMKPEDAVGYNPKFQVNGFRLGFSFSF